MYSHMVFVQVKCEDAGTIGNQISPILFLTAHKEPFFVYVWFMFGEDTSNSVNVAQLCSQVTAYTKPSPKAAQQELCWPFGLG